MTAFGCATGDATGGDQGGGDTGVPDVSSDGSTTDTHADGSGDAVDSTSDAKDAAKDTIDGGHCEADAAAISCGVGECTVTVPGCTEAGVPGTCKPNDPVPEVCDGKDNDCNGKIDDGFVDATCGMGECVKTMPTCVSGVPKTCEPGSPSTETCNGKDDDCDGIIDNNIAPLSCGVGECATTAPACVDATAGTCTPKAPTAEKCNGKDDDCNGTIDDGLPTLTCGVGACVTTTPSCFGGKPQVCLPAGGTAEICDGKDNDCNGSTDDGPSSTLCPPPAHSSGTACTGGKCTSSGCVSGFVDVNGDYTDGCECTDSASAHACADATGSTSDVGTVGVGSSKIFTSNQPINDASHNDWIKVTFLNTRTDKLAHPKIQFTTNPGSAFQFQVLLGTCVGTTPACGAEGGTATADVTWETSYSPSPSGVSSDPGWNPIAPEAYVGGVAHATVFVRVFYAPGAAATCAPYTLNFSN